MEKIYTDEAVTAGLDAIEHIYGKAARDISAAKLPAVQTQETLGHLMGDIWNRPGLSIAQRRLLVLGVAATVNDAKLVETIVGGGLKNGEFTNEQLDEIGLFLAFYIGWPRTGAFARGVEGARAAQAAA